MSARSNIHRQLALALPVDSRHGREDFLVGPSNEAAYAVIERWPAWPEPWLCLTGPEGAGKTHLAAIWADATGAATIDAASLAPDTLAGLLGRKALVIEDCDRPDLDQQALFHLMNAIRSNGGHLVLTSRTAPEHWDLSVRDLISRLRLAPQATIAAPDDGLLRALLVKLFIDRQLVVDTVIIETLAVRMERSFAAARQVVAHLDRMALERRKPVSRALVTEVLADLFPADDE